MKPRFMFDIKKLKKVAIISTLVIQVAIFFCYSYGDVFITTVHGINFWDCLFSGKLTEFYEYNLNAELVAGTIQGIYPANYDFMIYIIFGLWDFPLWVAQKILGTNYILDFFLGRVWAKSIVLIFIGLTVWMFYKILVIGQNDNKVRQKAIYLFVTSVFVTAYVGILGQYDIIPVFFILAGIYCLIENRISLFVLFFSIAIPIKAFSLLLFLILIVFEEKNLLKDFVYLFLGMIPTLVFKVLIPMAGSSNVEIFSDFLFQNRIKLSYGDIPVFVIGMVILAFISYIKEPATDNVERCKEVVFLSFFTFVVFLITCFALPYWFMYMVPFLYLLIGIFPERYTINMMLEICMAFFAVVGQVFYFFWCFSSPIVENMLISVFVKRNITEQRYPANVLDYFLGQGSFDALSSLIMPVCMAIFIGAAIIFAYVNSPWKRKTIKCRNDAFTNKLLYVVRLCLGYVICAIPLIAYLM